MRIFEGFTDVTSFFLPGGCQRVAAKRQMLEGHQGMHRRGMCNRSAGIVFPVKEKCTILANKLFRIQYFLQFGAVKKCCTGISVT